MSKKYDAVLKKYKPYKSYINEAYDAFMERHIEESHKGQVPAPTPEPKPKLISG